MNYWWVNQGLTYATESDGGYICAPQISRSGSLIHHHQNVFKVKSGDIIFHNSF